MIILITGKPGSGKSYYAVRYLLNLCGFDKKAYTDFCLRNKILVISNIDSLKVSHLPFKEDFLNVDVVRKLREKYNVLKVVFVLDEAQRFYGNVKPNDAKAYFLQYHRHLGVDILLITQTSKALPRFIFDLVDYEVEARKLTKTRFLYVYKMSGEEFKREIISLDRDIAFFYKSFDFEGSSSFSRIPTHLILFVFGAILLAAGSYYFFTHSLLEAKPVKLEKPADKPKPRPVSNYFGG